MNYIYITGTGSGIGKALAEDLLKDKNNKVIGLSRHKNITHRNYLHIDIDLSKISMIRRFRFERIENAKNIVLVNNAGSLGEVKHIGDMKTLSMVKAYNVNFMAPVILTNEFIKFFGVHSADKMIINISSGAAKAPVDGWGVYCSSKAGLNMYSAVLEKELQMDDRNDFRVFDISPGVVDTGMQEQIRQTGKENFSRIEEFRGYKENNILAQPEDVATEIKKVMQNPDNYKERFFRLNVDGKS